MTTETSKTQQTLETILAKLKALENNHKTVLDLEECAAYSGYSTSYLYKLTSTSQVPHYKPGGKKIFFKRTEIDEWLLRNPVRTQEDLEIEAEQRARRYWNR